MQEGRKETGKETERGRPSGRCLLCPTQLPAPGHAWGGHLHPHMQAQAGTRAEYAWWAAFGLAAQGRCWAFFVVQKFCRADVAFYGMLYI